MRFSQEPCVGVKVSSKCPFGGVASPGFFRYVGGMIVEDQLDRSSGWVFGVKELEEFDELAAAMAVFDESMDLAGQQIDVRQQTERAVALVFMIPGEGRMDAGFGRQIGSRRCNSLDAGLFIARDDWKRLALVRLLFDLLFDLARAFFSTSTSR
jgi:hypothetical protein